MKMLFLAMNINNVSECIIKHQLHKMLDDEKWSEQLALRTTYSTQHQLHRVRKFFSENFDMNSLFAVNFRYVTITFDKISHKGLISSVFKENYFYTSEKAPRAFMKHSHLSETR